MNCATSEMSRAKRSLSTVKRAKQLLPTFYERSHSKTKPVVWCMQGVPTELLEVFNLAPEWPENFGALCAARSVATSFITVAESEGYTGELCSYMTNCLGYCRRYCDVGSEPPESPPQGGLPKPIMLLGSGYMCDPRYKWFQTVATRYFQVPIFNSDPMSPPVDRDVDDPQIVAHYKEHLRADLKALVSFLEEHTGLQLDIEKFQYIMNNSQKSIAYWRSVYDLRKAIPCPMGAEDYFTCVIPQMFMMGTDEALAFFESLYNEVKQRVDNNIGVIPNEKYRLAFYGLPPWHSLGFFNYLESLGAVVVFEGAYYIAPPVPVDLTNPLEALVERIWESTRWHHSMNAEIMPEFCDPGLQQGIGSDLFLQLISEYQVDGVLLHRTRSCRPWSWGQTHYKNLLERAGVPTLIFESDMTDVRSWSDSRIKTQIEPFMESVAEHKASSPKNFPFS